MMRKVLAFVGAMTVIAVVLACMLGFALLTRGSG